VTTKTWRFITGHSSYADFSTSISPAVERAVGEGKSPPTVYLNIFDGDSITIGVNEDPYQVLDVDFCRANQIVTRRRVNGGGAIYAAQGSAFMVFYLPADLPGVPTSAAEAFPLILGHVAESICEIFGVAASYRPLNDVEIDGRKLIATSLKLESGVFTFRILINVKGMNTDIAAKAMPMAPEKVRDKKHKDLGSRYTWLEKELGRPVTHQELAAWVSTSVRRAFGVVKQVPGELSTVERGYADDFSDQLNSDAWFYDKSEATRYLPVQRAGDYICRGREKAPAGLIWLSFLLRDGHIVQAIVNGDWHPRPTDSVTWLEAGFEGLPATLEACRTNIEVFMARPDVEFAGVEVVHLMKAAELALASTTHAHAA